jgi:protein-disulfide isomerase
MGEVLPTVPGKVRVVFHHLPLGMHPWARVAAEGAACAQFQGSTYFWEMQQRIFLRQSEITTENVKAKLLEIAHATVGPDFNAFQTCVDNEMSLGLVLRDIDLASSNNVNATPTLFINGRRVQGVKDAKQLREIIDAAADNNAAENSRSGPGETAARRYVK